MILSFSGDPFLSTRAARRALRSRGFHSEETNELGEGMTEEQVRMLLAQTGLFGQRALYLDFDAAFQGQAGVKPRNGVMKVLEETPTEGLVVIVDQNATPARQKVFRSLGEHEHLPTPRFGALTHWVRQELSGAGVRFRRDVPEVLADLFGEDLPALSGEIYKLTSLDEELTGERVRTLANRLAARDAFDLIEAIAEGDGSRALAVCQSLLVHGESPARILGALSWQYGLVARCVALRESRAQVKPATVSQILKVKPFVARKALALAVKLDEARLGQVLASLLRADEGLKTGREAPWALEELALELSSIFASPSSPQLLPRL